MKSFVSIARVAFKTPRAESACELRSKARAIVTGLSTFGISSGAAKMPNVKAQPRLTATNRSGSEGRERSSVGWS